MLDELEQRFLKNLDRANGNALACAWLTGIGDTSGRKRRWIMRRDQFKSLERRGYIEESDKTLSGWAYTDEYTLREMQRDKYYVPVDHESLIQELQSLLRRRKITA